MTSYWLFYFLSHKRILLTPPDDITYPSVGFKFGKGTTFTSISPKVISTSGYVVSIMF